MRNHHMSHTQPAHMVQIEEEAADAVEAPEYSG